jgi:formylglycine-generating enzyme required for sulfatase activity
MKIEDVFKKVRTEVRSRSSGSQVPEERSSLEGDFYFARGSMVVEEPPPPSPVREPTTGKLTVKSNVGGAKVYIDAAYEGDEPVSTTLKPGAYSIILKKEGYLDATETVRVEVGGAKTISIVMEKTVPPSKDTRTFTSPTLGATFALISAGTFMMGSPTDETGRVSDEGPQHRVTISRPFYMQVTETTQGQWQKIMGRNPSNFSNCGDNCPVEAVSWNDVQDFIGRLNRQEGTDRYRLPTEAEWEYAARAGTTTRFYTGNGEEDLSRAGWYGDNSGSKTHPVGQKTPNAWGLYDMHGNVSEWVQDWKGDYPAGSVTDPEGPSSGSYRVDRGGSWFYDARYCRSAFRDYRIPDDRGNVLVGFRLIRMFAVSDSPSIDKSASVPGTLEIKRDGRFIAYDNGTVLDTRTKLMWAAKDNVLDINWQNAKSYCENYRGGGYSDWRMPTQDELAGLYDAAKAYKSDCGFDVHLTELIRLTCTATWASETRGSDAVRFYFNAGLRSWGSQSNDYFYRALPVRSGK